MDLRKLCILRRQGGVLKHFDVRAGSTAVIVYAYYIEPPLARWWQVTPVLARHFGDFPALVPVHSCLGRLHVLCCARFNFNKAKYIVVPSDQVDLSATTRRAIVTGDYGVAQLSEMKVSFLFATPSNLLVPRTLMRRQESGRHQIHGTNESPNYSRG